MAKFISDPVFDAALAKVATCTRMSICSAQPANFAGIAAVSLGSYVQTAGLGGAHYTAAVGDVSGRKVTMTARTGNNATANGSCTWVVLDDATTLHLATSCPAVTANSGQPLNTAAFKYESNQPT